MKKCMSVRIKDCVKAVLRGVFAVAYSGRYKKSRAHIESLRGKYSGKRCFIIGNGPSLRAKDLDKLIGEVSFGANRIYNIFTETDWRPTYYLIEDINLIRECKNEIFLHIKNEKFVGMIDYLPCPSVEGAYYYRIKQELYADKQKFSTDILECTYHGFTVTYTSIQMAVYMGFKEIYLIGMDHSYSYEKTADGNIIKNPGVKDHFSENDKVASTPQLFRNEEAYSAAREYCDSHGVKICNATRGGKLEIFERVNFDELF